MWNELLQEVVAELVMMLREMPHKKLSCALSLVKEILSAHPPVRQPCTLTHVNHQWLLPHVNLQRVPYVPPPEQRVEQRVISCEDQHMADNNVDPPILTRITDVPPIMAASNPTTKQALKLTKQTHSQQTRNNIPGGVPHHERQ